MLQVLGIIGGVIAFTSNIPYILDTIKGKTKPHRITWFVLVTLNVTFLANQLGSGADASLWLVVSFLVSTLTIFLLSIKKGVGGGTKLDYVVLAGSLAGLVLWWLFDSPAASTISNLVFASLAFIPTIIKSWHEPGTETNIKWLLGAIGAGFTVISVGAIDLPLLLLPVYSFVLNLGIYLILVRNKITPAKEK